MEVCIWGRLLVVSPIGSWSSSLVIRVELTGGSCCNLECMLSNLADSQKVGLLSISHFLSTAYHSLRVQ